MNFLKRFINITTSATSNTLVTTNDYALENNVESKLAFNSDNSQVNENKLRRTEYTTNTTISRVALNNDLDMDLIYIDDIDAGNLNSSFLDVLTKKSSERNTYNTNDIYEDDEETDEKNKLKQSYTVTYSTNSLFNPYYSIKTRGMHTNLPIKDTIEYAKHMNRDLSDCSIWKLLQLSSDPSEGQLRFRLSDFMYCKDLGKVANNHMIVLRKYASPIGDNIYAPANNPEYDGFATAPDIGHLVTWFGTEDNKLGDILKFQYKATWKEMDAQIQVVNSKAEDPNTGIFGMFANSANPKYNLMQGAGLTGTHNVISWLGSKIGFGLGTGGQNSQYGFNSEVLGNYDQHKIYEPQNTIRTNNYYEGKIEFSNEFSLKFSYKLRAYDTLNSKATMLDLIANILTVTFTKGKFWGGSVKMIGAPQNDSTLRKMNAFIDDTWDKLSGFCNDVLNGNFDWQGLMGSISDVLGNAYQSAENLITGKGNTREKAKEKAETYADKIKTWAENMHFSDAIKGQLKNALGRPALYAINSFVKGDVLGLWHVTIGNPRNPIVSMGNLIITNSEFSFGDAPLGLDDFPTEFSVTVSLKHCMPRDKIGIERMFNKGESSIYMPLGQSGWQKYFYDYSFNSGNESKIGITHEQQKELDKIKDTKKKNEEMQKMLKHNTNYILPINLEQDIEHYSEQNYMSMFGSRNFKAIDGNFKELT